MTCDQKNTPLPALLAGMCERCFKITRQKDKVCLELVGVEASARHLPSQSDGCRVFTFLVMLVFCLCVCLASSYGVFVLLSFFLSFCLRAMGDVLEYSAMTGNEADHRRLTFHPE